jgi:hypothetical protein
MTTMSLRLSVGTRHCSTYARKVFPVMEPSSTHGAVIPLRRRPATKVIVFQCPYGTWPTSRSPRRQRPLSRTILVLAAVSSMNTSRVVSSVPCSRIQRRRARATSARFCSAARRLFFEGDLMTLEEAPYRAAAAGNPSLVHRRDHLIQRQVRLVRNQREQTVRVLLQQRRARAARLRGATPRVAKELYPFDRCTGADLEVFRRLTPRSAAFNARNDASADICRICSRHRSTPKFESMPIDSLIHRPLGNPTIQLGRNML